jgi:hypothetical protein
VPSPRLHAKVSAELPDPVLSSLPRKSKKFYNQPNCMLSAAFLSQVDPLQNKRSENISFNFVYIAHFSKQANLYMYFLLRFSAILV